MKVIQRNAGSLLHTKRVYYKDGGVGLPLKAGYAVCYDHTEDLTPQGDEFDEMIRGAVVVRPATANLEFFAGIITKVGPRLRTGSDYSGFVDIAMPRADTFIEAQCNVNATVGTTVLAPTNNSFALTADASATADLYSRRTVGIAAETKNTSVTAGLALVKMIGK